MGGMLEGARDQGMIVIQKLIDRPLDLRITQMYRVVRLLEKLTTP